MALMMIAHQMNRKIDMFFSPSVISSYGGIIA